MPFLILSNMESGPWEKMKQADEQTNSLFDKRKQEFSAHERVVMYMIGHPRSKDD